MSGTAPRASEGACDERACRLAFGHRGPHLFRLCEREGCANRTRNAEEHFCVRHESRSTYDLYEGRKP